MISLNFYFYKIPIILRNFSNIYFRLKQKKADECACVWKGVGVTLATLLLYNLTDKLDFTMKVCLIPIMNKSTHMRLACDIYAHIDFTLICIN